MEQAVVREVLEESACPVDINSVKYFGSQPWPFPQSLMLGCSAQATFRGRLNKYIITLMMNSAYHSV